MVTKKEVDKATEELYAGFGTDTGILFGIPPNYKDAVSLIVKVILMRRKE